MTIGSILSLIIGILQFPSAVTALIKSLRETPEEQREALIKSIQMEADNFQKTGRPTWS